MSRRNPSVEHRLCGGDFDDPAAHRQIARDPSRAELSQKGKVSSLTKNFKAVGVGAVAVSAALLGMASAGAAQAAPTSVCTPNVGGSGMSAAVVARSNQRITHRNIRTRCDIGIYVGPGVSHVTIDSVRVSGANFQGILAENTSHLTIRNSTITGNGFHTIDPAAPPLPGNGLHSKVGQAFGISLFGVSYSTVQRNWVNNNGRGGIGVMDNGANNPGTITQHPNARLVASTHDTVIGNWMSANYNGCALVAATQNLSGHLSDLVLAGNTITGTGVSHGADVGGIVVAADLPNSSVRNVAVYGNKVSNSLEGGVIVNAEAPNSSTRNVFVTNNVLTGNNLGKAEAPATAGVIVDANPGAKNVLTVVAHNTITGQFYGIWSTGNYRPITFANHIRVTSGGVPIQHN